MKLLFFLCRSTGKGSAKSSRQSETGHRNTPQSISPVLSMSVGKNEGSYDELDKEFYEIIKGKLKVDLRRESLLQQEGPKYGKIDNDTQLMGVVNETVEESSKEVESENQVDGSPLLVSELLLNSSTEIKSAVMLDTQAAKGEDNFQPDVVIGFNNDVNKFDIRQEELTDDGNRLPQDEGGLATERYVQKEVTSAVNASVGEDQGATKRATDPNVEIKVHIPEVFDEFSNAEQKEERRLSSVPEKANAEFHIGIGGNLYNEFVHVSTKEEEQAVDPRDALKVCRK